MLLAVAVILGVVLLQKFDSGIDTGQVSASAGARATTSTTRRVTLTTVSATTTTLRARPKADVKVVVANGARISGLAGTATTTLKNAGYTPLPPADAAGTAVVDKTSVQYAEGYEAEAREVAAALGQPATVVAKLSATPPVAASDMADAKVVVVLGTDFTTSPSSTVATGAGSTTSTTKR